MKKLCSAIINWFKSPHEILSNISLLLCFITTLGVLTLIKLSCDLISPTLSLNCPAVIKSHQQIIYGSYSPKYKVAVYVHPEDGTFNYCLQKPTVSTKSKSWALNARFGNPYGKGHAKEPPLDYKVYAALFSKNIGKIPGSGGKAIKTTSEDEFLKYLRENYTKKIICCTIRRDLEECYYKPQILHPEKMINPRDNFTVLSPVKLEWKPNIPLYVELYHKGDPVKKYCYSTLKNYSEIKLEPGLYELKIKEYKESDCCDNVWFLVAQANGRVSKGGSP